MRSPIASLVIAHGDAAERHEPRRALFFARRNRRHGLTLNWPGFSARSGNRRLFVFYQDKRAG
jgi:hypothetical protein